MAELLLGGVDEAGRGPLAGPVVAAAVVLAPGQKIAGVRDSKKLSATRREALVHDIHSAAHAWSLGIASAQEIDRLNILHATMLAMQRAVAGLAADPELLRIDGNRSPDLTGLFAGQVETLVGGDDICPAIGCASILAKVKRDAIMADLHEIHPEYGFAQHKGYPTAQHKEALVRLGPTPEHRTSFRPVREAQERFESQQESAA